MLHLVPPQKEKKKQEEEKECPFLSVLVTVLLSALVERFSVSCMRDFLHGHRDSMTDPAQRANQRKDKLQKFTLYQFVCIYSFFYSYIFRLALTIVEMPPRTSMGGGLRMFWGTLKKYELTWCIYINDVTFTVRTSQKYDILYRTLDCPSTPTIALLLLLRLRHPLWI